MRTLVTLGLGALAMYFLDPEKGRRRRALIRDQFVHAGTVARKRATGAARDLSNRAYGATMEARRAIRTEPEAGQASETPQGAQHLGR
jgi:hypothetical protein